MAEPTIQLGGGNWAGKTDNLLGYYKEGERFYKQDFTFSRSTTGTYTDSDGYIQEMPYNLLQYSEDFSNSFWTKTDATVTSGFVSPNNTNNAFKLLASANNGQLTFSAVATGNSNTKAISVFAKANTTTSKLRIVEQYYSGHRTDFDLNLGTIIYSNSGGTSTIENVGNGWYRCTHIQTYTSGQNLTVFAFRSALPDSFLIWGAQLEEGTSAKTYFPTTTRLNMPRVSYLNNSNGSLILEPQRTNLIEYSNFSSGWSLLSGGSIAHNQTVSPDGTQNASVLSGNGADDNAIYDALNLSVQSYTLSVFAKQKGVSILSLKGFTSGALGLSKFNLSNGTIETASSNQFSDEKIENYGNGWYRCSVKVTPTSSGSKFFGFKGEDSDSGELFSLYGAQLEVGSHPTSLIKTSGSSVTRNADACSLTNVADRIGQTEGTIYGEFDFKDHSTGTRRLLCLTDGSSSNRITTYINGLDKLSVYIVNGGAAQADIQATVLTEGTIKYALAYANNSIKLYLNGTQVGTDTSATIPATSDFLVGFEHSGLPSYFNWRNCQIYSTALSDSELATLTTL